MAKRFLSYTEWASLSPSNRYIEDWVKYNWIDGGQEASKKYIIQTNTTPVAAVRVIGGIRAVTNLGLKPAKNACLDIYGEDSGDITEIIRLITAVTGSEENRPYVGVFGAYDTREEAEAVLESIVASSRIYFEVAEVVE